jgi:hypothetical protein
MSLALSQPPMRRFSNLLYKKPNLYLSLLLVPPLIWFGAIYLGSLLTLLWQGFYTFDDFTMAVTPDLTLAGSAFRGQSWEMSFESVYAFREDGSWGEVYSYKFNTGEIKGPLHRAAAEAGWGWKGVAFGKL